MNAFLSFLCLANLFSEIYMLHYCETNDCQGMYKLKTHEIHKPNIEITKTSLKVTSGVSEIEVIYTKRKRLTIYCYDGSGIDPNTGCYENIENYLPKCSMAREWNVLGTCPTGYECSPDGTCTGSDAYQKCYDKTTMTTQNGPKALKWIGARYMIFAKHTCVSSWECLNFKARIPTFAKVKEGKNIWVYYDKDNKEHETTNRMYEIGDKSEDSIQCLSDPIQQPTVESLNANCYSESQENIKCIVTSEGSLKGLVMDIDMSLKTVYRHMIIEVTGPLYVIKDNEIINIGMKEENNRLWSGDGLLVDANRAVNVESLHETVLSISLLQMQTLYNILSLTEEVERIYNMNNILISSISKLDPYLLSRILQTNRFYTKWANQDIFEMCPCYQQQESNNSNCVGNLIFSNGDYMENNDSSRCFEVHEREIKNISLIEDVNIATDTIKNLPEQTASSDSSAWDVLNDYRNHKLEGDTSSHSYENLSDKVNKLLDEAGLSTLKAIFLYSSAAAAWLALFSSLCCRRG